MNTAASLYLSVKLQVYNFLLIDERRIYKLSDYKRRYTMSDSVYKVIELVGTSSNSWEDAAKNAVERAAKSLTNLRVAEVRDLDMKVEDGKVTAYRAKVSLSFKYKD